MINFACKKIELKDLVKCSFGLNKTEYIIFNILMEEEGYLTIKQLSDKMDLDRTTIQKAIKNLVENEAINRSQQNLNKGGYIFLYKSKSKEELKRTMEKVIKEWYEKVIVEINEW